LYDAEYEKDFLDAFIEKLTNELKKLPLDDKLVDETEQALRTIL